MKKVLLIILDGFGLGKKYPGNAYERAKKPFFEMLFRKYPWVKLKASGHAVGIPEGTQGGSEVGHFTMGAGRVTWQTLESINQSIRNKNFFKKRPLLDACRKVRNDKNSALHLFGMISDQGVHSHINHLFALLELAKKEKAFPVYIHAVLDGRDVPEKSAIKYINQIQNKIHSLGLDGKAKIATMIGRYFAMDRDMNWKRTEKAYDLLALGKGRKEKDPIFAIKNAYRHGLQSDYYLPPHIVADDAINKKTFLIRDNDSMVFWSFRTDRERQLCWSFTGETPPKETKLKKIGFTPKKIVRPFVVAMGPFSNKAPVLFPTPVIKNNLGEVLSKNHVRQLRIAETEKYAHVTFFFNSQVEKPFPKEDRVLIHSPKVPSYAQKPEMSAYGVTSRLIQEIKKEKYGFIAANFANCDLVGHSGNLKASIKAVEVVDECLSKIVPLAQKNGYTILITGDHGNVEYKLYDRTNQAGVFSGKPGTPCPSHTTNPVPLILISKNSHALKKGHFELKDIAPTVLKILDLKKPKEMSSKGLISLQTYG